jgi:hypothetical protein
MPFGLTDFDRRSRLRHDNGHGNTEPVAVISDRLCVIAGGCRNDSAGALLGRKLEQLVQRSALFECRSELQILEL